MVSLGTQPILGTTSELKITSLQLRKDVLPMCPLLEDCMVYIETTERCRMHSTQVVVVGRERRESLDRYNGLTGMKE